MKRVLIVALAPLWAACATGNSVRELGVLERQAILAVDSALTAKEPTMQGAAETLGELGADYARREFELELSLAKAKQLEAMQAPWAAVEDEMAKTQRAVVLYHLYELEMAESRVLDARMAERRASAQEMLQAYQRLAPLLRDAAQNMEVLLRFLNQPKSAQIRSFSEALLSEVSAFREGLVASENPELEALAEDVVRYEEFAHRARERASLALDQLTRLRGNDDDG